ncbi:MAG TPA: 4-hydroxy-tetrahydrodipicolinate reductase [Candidatus Pelethenecus faecipullorum]|uniref:4-hydroxy-tetrahydrodipicolinate reductase n=1 Tax=Candidatus Pelethenecus faecipullorum TaxID=2840900 RepID=A0A9D1GR37_9MOLU|nr:4-hydroxy-tetrahydrodipicolinate reductase [Candidatus Pelethenecus faecipullorum]
MKICVVGYGAMGKLVSSMAKEELACVVAKESPYQTLEAAPCPFDIIVDFSHPDNLEMIRTYALKHSIPVLFATTGYTDRQLEQIEELSKSVPVLRSANFSLGVILLNRLLKQIVPLLKDDFDIEVTEAHHHYKVDAPSGTAKMFLKTIVDETGFEERYDRLGYAPRKPNEIGVHSIRGGSIVGDHEILFCGEDEVIKLSHHAQSKKIFAVGALKAARFLLSQEPGSYTMEDVLFQKEIA